MVYFLKVPGKQILLLILKINKAKDTYINRKLVKIPFLNFNFLIKELIKDKEKIAILDILSNQLNYLIKEGKTKEEEFEKELQNTLLGVSSQLLINSKPQAEFIKLDNFIKNFLNQLQVID